MWLTTSSAQIFRFCNSNVTTFPTSKKYRNFNFPFTLSQRKCYISRSILRLFINFFLVKEEEGGNCGWKLKFTDISVLQSNVTTFSTSRKSKSFNFSLHTVPAEMLYLQTYFTNFLKLFFGSNNSNRSIVVKNIKCTDILVLQYQRYNFSNIQKM